MTDPRSEEHGGVATAAPPAKPPAPPTTATAAPKPPGKRGPGCALIGLVLLGVFAVALGLGLWWVLSRPTPAGPDPAASSSAFDSAMTKAMVKAPSAPADPVELSSVKARGTHSFEATFTGEELSALANAFKHDVTVGNMSVALSRIRITPAPDGGLALSGSVASGSSAYSGRVTGVVVYRNNRVVADGPLAVEAEGFPLSGAQADQATELLLAYVNGYLAAAPGLTITSASVTPDGVHVVGLAPDTISY